MKATIKLKAITTDHKNARTADDVGAFVNDNRSIWAKQYQTDKGLRLKVKTHKGTYILEGIENHDGASDGQTFFHGMFDELTIAVWMKKIVADLHYTDEAVFDGVEWWSK